MNKILLIIKREYLTKVRKKAFLITTFLFPLLTGSIWLIPVWLAVKGGGEEKKIWVLDHTGAVFKNQYKKTNNLTFEKCEETLELAKLDFSDKHYYGLLYIPKLNLEHPKGITLWTIDNPNFEVPQTIEGIIETQIENIKLEGAGIDRTIIEKSKTDISLETLKLDNTGEKQSNAGISSILSYASGVIIYIVIFVYGIQVMRGVMEEKSSRIVEVIISSVKPFQLMMGKIIGTAAVAFTQLFLWLTLTFIVSIVASKFSGISNVERIQQNIKEKNIKVEDKSSTFMILEKLNRSVNLPQTVGLFFIYFLGGYLLYSSLFAAIGSAIDTETDTQQFMLPVMMPLFLSVTLLSQVLKDHDGPLAFWLSIIPLTSPVIMMGRLPFEVPLWQIVLSVSLLIGGFIFTTWLAGRIYRVGILMYGKKVTYKELAKWFFVKI